MKIKVPKIYLYEKQTLVRLAFQLGMLTVYMGSLYPWFMWKLTGFYVIFAAMLIAGSILMARTMKTSFYSRHDFLLPLMAYSMLTFYQLVVNGNNVNAYITNCFSLVVYFSLFVIDREELNRLSDFLSKSMGVLQLVSIPFFLLFLVGFSLPHVATTYLDGYYSFDNYFFFLHDDRAFYMLFPRFQSVFLEPNHLGTATVLLLLTQCGKWRRWYNVVMILATLLSFSLSAYILLLVTVILHLWIRRQHFIGKLLAVVVVISGIVVASFYYNGGDNLLHDLILIRMEMDEGELNEDSRVTADFESEFESYLHSSDVLFGRDMGDQFERNSGYEVYIYENGFVGLFLFLMFYLVSMWQFSDRRYFVATMVMVTLTFIARGYPLWYNYYLPFYCMSMMAIQRKEDAKPKELVKE